MKAVHHIGPLMVSLLVASCGDRGSPPAGDRDGGSFPLLDYSTKSDEARRHTDEGERLDDMEFWNRANAEFKLAADADSTFGYANLRAAQALVDYLEEEPRTKRAVAHVAGATPIERLLIEAGAKAIAHDDAGRIADLKRATEIQPTNPRLWVGLGRAYVEMNRASEAGAAFERARALDSAFVAPVAELAALTLADSQPNLSGADSLIGEVIHRWPDAPRSYHLLGDLRQAQGRYQEAVDAYSRLIALDPESGSPPIWRAGANILAGHFDAARADLDMAMHRGSADMAQFYAFFRAYLPAFQGDYRGTSAALAELRTSLPGLGPKPALWIGDVGYDVEFYMTAMHRDFAAAETALAVISAKEAAPIDQVNQVSSTRRIRTVFMKGVLAAYRGDADARLRRTAELHRMARGDSTARAYEHRLRGLVALLDLRYVDASSEFSLGDPGNDLRRTSVAVLFWRGLAAEGMGNVAAAKAFYRAVRHSLATGIDYALPAVFFDATRRLEALR